MTKLAALKKFFGTVRPLTTQELLQLRKEDAKGFDWMAAESAKVLGETISD